jgi:hypothetical protein
VIEFNATQRCSNQGMEPNDKDVGLEVDVEEEEEGREKDLVGE